MLGFVLSNLIGLIRQILVGRAFGTGADLDAFYAAQRIPEILFMLVAGGALASAFVPTFTGFLARDERQRAWRLASGVINLVTLLLALAGLLAGTLAPALVAHVLAPGFPPEQQALTVSLLRVLLISSVIFGVSGLLMGILNAHQHFLLPAIAPSLYWLGMIAGVVLLAPHFGIQGLAYGVVLGAALHLGVQLPGLRGRGGRYWPALGLRDPAVRQVARLMGPRVLGLGVVQVNFLVNAILASRMVEGSLSAITIAWQILTMPEVVIAQAVAIAALPTLSAQVARGELAEMRGTLATALRGILFLAVPASAGLLMLRTPIVRLLFERGEFTAQSTRLVAWALAGYSLGLIAHSVVEILSRAFYALHDTRTPVAIGAAAMALNVALSLLLASLFARVGWLPHGGLALANSAATTLEMVGLIVWLRARLGGLDGGSILPGLAQIVVASALMSAVLAGWLAATAGQSAWLEGIGGVLLGGAAYWGAALALRNAEARSLPRLALGRLTQG